MKGPAGESGRVCAALLRQAFGMSPKTPAHISQGSAQVRARQEALLPLSSRGPVARGYLLAGVMARSGMEVAASSWCHIVHVTLTVPDVLTGFVSEQSAHQHRLCKTCKLQGNCGIVLRPSSVCVSAAGAHLCGNGAPAADALSLLI